MSNEPFNDELLADVSGYVDNILDDGEREALEARLQRDEPLRAELATLRRVDALVRASAVAVPEFDSGDFLAEARRRREAARRPVPALRWLSLARPLAAAAVVVMVVTAGLIWSQESADEKQVASESMVTLVRPPVDASDSGEASSSWVELTRAPPESAIADVGPLPVTRTLIVSVAGRTDNRATERASESEWDEEAGYF